MAVDLSFEPNYYKQLLLEAIGSPLVEELFALEGDLLVDIPHRRYELIDCPDELRTKILYRLNYIKELADWEEFNADILTNLNGIGASHHSKK